MFCGKRKFSLHVCLCLLGAALAFTESPDVCDKEDEGWCAKFTMYCDYTNALVDMKNLCPNACGYCDTSGNFSQWSNWTECSVTCGNGVQTRSRSCNATKCVADEHGEEVMQKRQCFQPCEEMWGAWTKWGECSATCGGGTRQKTRNCLLANCKQRQEVIGQCNEHECPTWSKWSRWSQCSKTCGGGERVRTRTCMNGPGCRGNESEETTCGEEACKREIRVACIDKDWCRTYGFKWCSAWFFSKACPKLCDSC